MTARRVGQKWRIDIKYKHPDGRLTRVRKVAVVQTKRGAQQEEQQIRLALLNGTYRREEEPKPKEIPKFSDFAEECLRTYFASHNRPRTVREKQRTLARAILPALGKLRLDEIRPRIIEGYKAERLAKGLAAKTVNEEVAIVQKILRIAVEWEIVEACPRFTRLKQPPPETDFLDFSEADRLIAAALEDGDPWGPMVFVGIRTGLRRGELRGLRWEDVDLVRGRIVVRVAADDLGELHPPKNGRTREVELGDEVTAVLRSHRHLRGRFVFCNEDGSMITNRQCESPLVRICRRAGLRQVGWHSLRHTFASHLVMRGAPMKAVQELLGHATLQMTLRYAHLSPDVRRDVVRLLDRSTPATNQGQHGGNAPAP